MSVRVLAKRPPATSLAMLAIYGGIVFLIALIFRYFIENRDHLLDPPVGGAVVRIGLLVVLGFIALISAGAGLRIAQRWTTHRSRIAVDGDQLVTRLPSRRAWWRPLERRMIETRVPLSKLRALRIISSVPAWLEIETTTKTLVVQSSQFAVGVFTLDARLRELTGAGAWPHPLAKVVELQRWSASPVVRSAMPILGAVLLVGGFFVTGALRSNAGVFPVILGLGMFGAMAVYRGRIVLDARGIFFERSGATSYLAWSELDLRAPNLKSNFLGMWRELDIPSAKTSTVRQHISLNQVLWLGFPLSAIAKKIRELAPQYR